MISNFAPDTLLHQRQTSQLKPSADAEIALREGLFAHSRSVDAERVIIPSFGIAALSKLALVGYDREVRQAAPTTAALSLAAALDVSVAADYRGQPKAGELPRVLVPTVLLDGVDAHSSGDIAYLVDIRGATGSVNTTGGSGTKGFVTLTAVDSSRATVTLTVVYKGQQQPGLVTTISKINDDPPPPPPVTVDPEPAPYQGALLFSPSATELTRISDIISMAGRPDRTFRASAPTGYDVLPGNGVRRATVAAVWRWRFVGQGSWQDFGPVIVGSEASASSPRRYDFEFEADPPEQGFGDFSQQFTPATAGGYEFALFAQRSGSAISIYGNVYFERTV